MIVSSPINWAQFVPIWGDGGRGNSCGCRINRRKPHRGPRTDHSASGVSFLQCPFYMFAFSCTLSDWFSQFHWLLCHFQPKRNLRKTFLLWFWTFNSNFNPGNWPKYGVDPPRLRQRSVVRPILQAHADRVTDTHACAHPHTYTHTHYDCSTTTSPWIARWSEKSRRHIIYAQAYIMPWMTCNWGQWNVYNCIAAFANLQLHFTVFTDIITV